VSPSGEIINIYQQCVLFFYGTYNSCHLSLNLIHFLLASTRLALVCYTTYPSYPQNLLFLPPKLNNIYSLLLKAQLGRGFKLILGASLNVIDHTLNNCKSFLLNAEQVSILWPGYLAWYSHVSSSLHQFMKGGYSGRYRRGATWLKLSNFPYISFKGIGRDESCSWILW
jgi:hypothetical protein